MKAFFRFLNSEIVKDIMQLIKIIVMILLIYIYLLNTDLTTTPEFIYNQF